MRRAGLSEVGAPRVDGVRTGHPVEEQQPEGVVDLVLHGDRLEGIRLEGDPLAGDGELPADREPSRAGDVAGEVRDRHAALPAPFPPGRLDDLGVAEDEEPVAGPGLRMTGDVDTEHPPHDTNLLSGQPHTAWRTAVWQ